MNSKRLSNPAWCVYHLHECTSPHQLVDIKQRVRDVCSPAAPPGWSGPAPRDCWKPSAPPLSDPGSSTASWSQRKSVRDRSHHSVLQGLETWPGALTQAEERPRNRMCEQRGGITKTEQTMGALGQNIKIITGKRKCRVRNIIRHQSRSVLLKTCTKKSSQPSRLC